METDEQTIKVLARFTEVGQWWPVEAWILFRTPRAAYYTWWPIKNSVEEGQRIRRENEICELEANQK